MLTTVFNRDAVPCYAGPVFVRRVETRAEGAASGVSYRLVHSRRLGPRKVRQIVLAYFPAGLEERVPKTHWKLLAASIQRRLSGQAALLDQLGEDPEQRALAERIEAEAEQVAPVARRRLLDADFDIGFKVVDDPRPAGPREKPLAVLPSTLRHTDVREVGAARLLHGQAQALGLRECLAACGLRPRYVRLALAQILARALHPASERETLRWLRDDSALGELLGLRPGDLAKDALRAAADALWKQRGRIESAVFARERALFGLRSRIVFYHLTNTCHTGLPGHDHAAHRRSQQQGHEAPLVTLGLLLDGAGFPRRSEVLAGNVGEARTLQAAIERLRLGAGERPTVVFNGGIVSAETPCWLRERGLHWITMDRQRQAVPERAPDTPRASVGTPGLKVWRLRDGERASADRSAAGEEVRLCVWSPARDKGGQSILDRKRKRYEAALQSLHEGLSVPRRLKSYAKVVRKVGRLEREYKLVASQYTVTVEAGEKGKAQAVRWEPNRRYGKRERLRGASLLRTSRADWTDSRIVREYCRLADIEATFQSFKEERGLRPLSHRPAKRVAVHLFVTVLAYHVVHALRRDLKRKGITYSWRSIRERMRTWVRLTTVMRTAEEHVSSQRQDMDPNNEQARIAAAAGVRFRRHRQLLPVESERIVPNQGSKEGKMQQNVVSANPLRESSSQ